MPTITDVPSGAGSVTTWAGTYSDVTTDNADTTVISSDTSGAEERWTFPSLPAGLITPAVSAVFTAKARQTSGTPTMAIYTGTGWGALAGMTGSYATYQVNAASLVLTTLQGYESGVQRGAQGVGNNINCTYATRAVVANYIGGFVFDYCSWLVPIMGAAVDLATFHRATALLRQGPRLVRFSPSERVEMFRAWREYRHPRFA